MNLGSLGFVRGFGLVGHFSPLLAHHSAEFAEGSFRVGFLDGGTLVLHEEEVSRSSALGSFFLLLLAFLHGALQRHTRSGISSHDHSCTERLLAHTDATESRRECVERMRARVGMNLVPFFGLALAALCCFGHCCL